MYSNIVVSAWFLYFLNQYAILTSQLCNIYGMHYRIWPWNRLFLYILLIASDPLMFYLFTRNMMRFQYIHSICFSLLLGLFFVGMAQTLKDQNWYTTFFMFMATSGCILQHYMPRFDDLLDWQRTSGWMLCDVWLLAALAHSVHAAFLCCLLPAATIEVSSLLHSGLGLRSTVLALAGTSCFLWALTALFLTHRAQLGIEARKVLGEVLNAEIASVASVPAGSASSTSMANLYSIWQARRRRHKSAAGLRGLLYSVLVRESGELRESMLLRSLLVLLTFTSVAYVVVALDLTRRFGFLLVATIGLLSANLLWSRALETVDNTESSPVL